MLLDYQKGFIYKVIEWIFYFFIATFPFLIYQGFFFPGTATRVVNLIIVVEILVLLLAILLFKKNINFGIIKSPITLIGLVFLAIITITSIHGVDFSSSFWSKATRMTGIFYFFHLGLFYLFCVSFFDKEGILKNFLKIILLFGGLFSILSLLSGDGFGLIFNSKVWTGFTIGNSTFAAMYLYAVFMLSIYWVFSIKDEIRKWWYYLLPVIFLINPYIININIWTGQANFPRDLLSIFGEAQATAYTIFASIIAVICVHFVLKIKNRKITNTIVISGVIVGILIVVLSSFSFLSPNGYLQKKYLERSSPARPMVWNIAKQAINDKPWLGWGNDNFDRAFELHYDNRLLEGKNGSEPWFDRAHNIFLDQLVETGYIGLFFYLLIYLILIICLLYVFIKTTNKKNQYLSVILIIYFVGHLIEIQTVFDTSISYVPFVIMMAVSAVLYYQVKVSQGREKLIWSISENYRYIIGTILIVFVSYSFVAFLPILKAEIANGYVKTVGSGERRLPFYPTLFGSNLDQATLLWRTTTDFQRGIAQNLSVLSDPKKREFLKKELELFIEKYAEYLKNHPSDFRSHLGLANVLIYQRLFEVDHLKEAQIVLDKAIKISPTAPQPYYMKAVTYLYMRKFDLAREWAKNGYNLNSNIEQGQNLVTYIENSIKTFPEIDLYVFW